MLSYISTQPFLYWIIFYSMHVRLLYANKVQLEWLLCDAERDLLEIDNTEQTFKCAMHAEMAELWYIWMCSPARGGLRTRLGLVNWLRLCANHAVQPRAYIDLAAWVSIAAVHVLWMDDNETPLFLLSGTVHAQSNCLVISSLLI